MTENDIWAILKTTFEEALTAAGLTDVKYKRAYQPRQQGAIVGPALYCFKLTNHRYGWQSRKDEYNEADDDFDTSESRVIETTFQVSSEADEDPADTSLPTAFDIVEEVSSYLNTKSVRLQLKEQGLNIIRILDIRQPFFKNESDRFEQEPSFDFTISYQKATISKTPKVTEFESNTDRI